MTTARLALAIDVPILAATLLASAWVVTHTDRQLESALGLVSTQWLYDMDADIKQLLRNNPAPEGRPSLDARGRYARDYPRSPIAVMNRIPGALRAEEAIAKGVERGLPALAIATVGLGIVAVRRPGPTTRRPRRGPGRVAAAIGLIVASASIAVEFVLRRFDLMKYGSYHDTMDTSWATAARTAGVAVLAGWLLMAAPGRRARPKGRRECLGLALGVVWLIVLVWLVVLAPLAQLPDD